jgi:hypothetical protein
MKMCSLPWSGVKNVLFQNKLALLGGVLLCLAPLAVSGQSVTYNGQWVVLPFSGLNTATGIALDSTGDVFVADAGKNTVVELPWTGTGYGTQTTLPTSGLDQPSGIAMDNAGDLFIADTYNSRIVELPQTGTGYGPQVTLPFTFSALDRPIGVAVDNTGDVFETDNRTGIARKLPHSSTGYGSQITLPTDLSHPNGIALDSEGNVFIADGGNHRVVELPKAGTGYGPQIAFPFADNACTPWGIAVDGGGDVFDDDFCMWFVAEYAKTKTGYGPAVVLPYTDLFFPTGVAVNDTGEDVYVVVQGFQSVTELHRQSFDFGRANICAPGHTMPAPCSQTMKLSYNVTASGTLGTPQVLTGGAPNLDFTLTSGSTCTGAVTEGSTCTVYVTFAPLATGVRNGAVEIINSSGTVLATTPIYGVGVAAADAPPVAQVSTSSLQFGLIAFGNTESLPLTVTNIGGGALTVMPSIAGQSFIIAGNTCQGVTTGNSCTLQVEFSPATAGKHSEVLTLQNNGSTTPTVLLQGFASAGPVAQVSTTTLNFGTIAFGSTATLPLTVTNIGAGTLTVASSTNLQNYTITASTCGGGVTTGNSCTLQVEFQPVSVGNHFSTWTLQTNGVTNPITGKATPMVAVNGVAIGLSAGTSALQFGSILYGATEVLPLTVTNFGLPGTVTVGTSFLVGRDYTVLTTAQNTCQAGIATGQSCTLPVEFSPISVGHHYDVLTLTPSAGAAPTLVGLEGTATAAEDSVTFAGAPTTLPFSGLGYITGVASDSAGNLFISEQNPNSVVEALKTATGFGPLTTLPFSGLNGPVQIAVDSAENVFVQDDTYSRGHLVAVKVLELPWTRTGYGVQTALPFSSSTEPSGIAVDSFSDVFTIDAFNEDLVVELPKTGTGYGPQTTLPFSGVIDPGGMAVDSVGDVFITDLNKNYYGQVVESPKTSTGYGAQTPLSYMAESSVIGPIAVDSARNILLVNYYYNSDAELVADVLELPWTGTGYGTPRTLPFSSTRDGIGGIAVDSAGDVFIIEDGGVVEELEKNSVNFGSAYVCPFGQTIPAPCSQTLTLYYNVNADTTLGTPKVLTGGIPGRDFTLASGNTCTGAVTTGSSCSLTVIFAPLAAGVRNGGVQIVDGNGTVLTTTPIYGLGVAAAGAPPVVQLSATSMQFGDIAVNTTETLPLTITNIGGETLTIASASIKGGTYMITGNTCEAGSTTGRSCTLQIEFAPPTLGAHLERLTLQTNAGAVIVTLYGKALAPPVAPPAAAVQPNYLQFGTIPLGTTETLPVNIFNNGGGALSVVPSISGYSSPPPSTYSYSIAANSCGGGVTSGCTLQVQFSPTSISANHDDILTLQTNAGTFIVNLVGAANGLSVLGGVSGGPLQFGSVSSGSTKVLLLTVTNVGLPGTVTIGTGITARTTATPTTTYTILATSQNTCLAGISAGQSCTLPIEFAPTSSGTHDDLLTLIPSTGGGSTTVWLVGSTP